MKDKLRLVVMAFKAFIYWELLMVMLKMSEGDPVLLESLTVMVQEMEEPDEED